MELQKLVIKAHRLDMQKKLVKKGYSEKEAADYITMCEKEPITDLLREILEEKKLSEDEIEKYFDVVSNPQNIAVTAVENIIKNNVPQHQRSAVEMVVATTPMLIVALSEMQQTLGVEIKRIHFDVKNLVSHNSHSASYGITDLFRIIYHDEGAFTIYIDNELYQSSIERYEILQKNIHE